MHRLIRSVLPLLALVAALAVPAVAMAGGPNIKHAVYTLSNSPGGNAVLAFQREGDGTLGPAGSFSTFGTGTGAGLGSQGAVVLGDDGKQLFAVNPGSNSVTMFAVTHDGLEWKATVPSGGVRPISLTAHKHLLYVLNAGGAGSITGFAVDKDGIAALAGSTQPLGPGDAGPAEVAFSPDGEVLVVTNKTSNTIDTYAVGHDGLAGFPIVSPSFGGTPFGFDFDKRGNVLVSNAAGSASSYAVTAGGALSVVSAAVATHQAAPCWLVASKNGRYAYTANAGSGTISGFAVGHDGSLALLDPSGATANVGAGSHPLDEAVSGNGRYFYVLADGFHAVSGYEIGKDGSLTPVGVTGGLPAGAMGLAAS